jgi:hypothetical protein
MSKKKPVAWMKIYTAQGDYVASCVDTGCAAALMSMLGDGATIRNGHTLKHTLWREGSETHSAAESYDYVTARIAELTTAT